MSPDRFIFPSAGFHHYWTVGHGKKMITKLSKLPTKEEIELDLPKLMEFDALADNVIHEVYFKMGFKEANLLIDTILEKGINAVPNVPESVKKLFTQVEKIPSWLEKEKIEEGSKFCRRSGIMGLIVLRDYCLMGGYESSAINKPLIFTGALKKGAAKRMAETIEFWVNVTGENALNKFEIGFRSTIKVRLMHAFARVSILKEPTWKNESWGIPINTWDMIATNFGFSLVFMNGLKNLGFVPSKKEVDGLLHFWKYIGYLLGIPEAYLPDTEEQAIKELYKWTITQPPADNDTKSLALALKNEPLLSAFPKRAWQKKLLVEIHLTYNQFFLGQRSCEAMGLPTTKIKYYPYIVLFIKRMDEFFAMNCKLYYNITIKRGRKNHVKIKDLFLKGHNSNKMDHEEKH
jgi:hypothetical protein